MSETTISAEEFKRAVANSGLTMVQVARLLEVDRSHVYNYRDGGVSKPARVEHVRRLMGPWLDDENGDPYEPFTDQQLLEELGRRIARLRTSLEQSETADGAERTIGPDVSARGDGLGRYQGTGRGPSEDARSVANSGDTDNDQDDPRL